MPLPDGVALSCKSFCRAINASWRLPVKKNPPCSASANSSIMIWASPRADSIQRGSPVASYNRVSPSIKIGIVVEIGVELGLAVLVSVEQASVGESHMVENKAGGSPRGLEVTLVLEDAPAFGQGRDHQAIPGDQDLGVLGWRHTPCAHGQELGAAGHQLLAELILIATQQFGCLADCPWQIQDVVLFPVALLCNVVNVTKCLGSICSQNLGHFGARPDVVLPFNALTVGIFG